MLRALASCLVVSGALNLTAPSFAAGTSIDLTTVILDDKGAPVKDALSRDVADERCEKCPPLTMGLLFYHVLLGENSEDKLPFEQKYARAVLGTTLRNSESATLSVEERAVILRQVGRFYGAIVLMQAMKVLDPDKKPEPVR